MQSKPQPSPHAAIHALREMLQPDQFVAGVASGLIAGIINLTVIIAFASLIFAGVLSGYRADGIGLILFSSTALALVGAMFSSFKGMILTPQDAPAALMALVAAAIASAMPASAPTGDVYITVVAAIGLTAIGTGIVFVLLGILSQGDLVRYVPYPVVGGFLAGTGLLLAQGAVAITTDVSVSFTERHAFEDLDLIVRWLPALAMGILLLVLMRRYNHPLLMPTMLVGVVVVVYGVLLVTGTSLDTARDTGWLLETFSTSGSGSSLWQPITLDDLSGVEWAVLAGQIGQMAAVVFVAVIGLLLNATGVELGTEQDIDLNRELLQTGSGNIVAGLGGGLAGYVVLGETMLSYKLGARSRLPGLVMALFSLLVMVAGGGLLAYVPKTLLGGLVFLIGLDFLVTWLYDYWSRLTRAEYAIMLAIMFVINLVGFLQGIALGIVVSGLLFIINYSVVGVVKRRFDGTTFNSNVVRPPEIQDLLRAQGRQIAVFKLQGYVFFGTANQLLEQVRDVVEAAAPHFVLLDFHLVTGLDSSAMLSFTKMKQIAQRHDMVLVFTALPDRMFTRFERDFPVLDEITNWHYAPDLDYGMEWCEDRLIVLEDFHSTLTPPPTLQDRIGAMLGSPAQACLMMDYLERADVAVGEVLVRQGTPPHSLIFIETGQVSIQLEREGQPPLRIRKMRAGTIVGELSVYLNQPTTASVVAEQPSTVLRLKLDALRRLEYEHPDTASAFHKFMARFLAERVTQTTDTLNTLVD